MKTKKLTSLLLSLALLGSLALPAQAAQGGSLIRATSAAVSAAEPIAMPVGTSAEAMTTLAGEGYSDTAGHYAAGVIDTWSGYGVLKGYEDNTFRPDGTITRAELAAVLNRVMGYQDAAENTFADLPAERWYTDGLLRLAQQGIFGGDEDKKMNPEAPITRQETFAAMARALALEESKEAPGFKDDDSIADWAKGYVSAMKKAGYIEGDQQGNIRGGDPITRAEVVTILNKMVSAFVNTDGTYSEDCEGSLFVNAHDVTLKDMTIGGDLVITDGVGDGDVYLDKVTVKGDIILRGCGENSFHIMPGCNVKKIIVTKTTIGLIRLVNESGEAIPMIYVSDGKAGVTLDGGELGEVVIACDAPVSIKSKKVKTLSVVADAKVTVEKGTTVSKMIVGKTAANATVTVSGKVNKLTNDAKIKVDKQGGTVGGSSSSSSSSGGSYTPPATSPSPAPSESPEPDEPTTINEATIQLAPPRFGRPVDLTAEVMGVGYTAEVKWFNADGSEPTYRWKPTDSEEEDTYTADHAYKAVVTLSTSTGYVFDSNLKIKVINDGKEFTPAKTEKNGSDWVLTMEYEKTEPQEYIWGLEINGPDFVYANETATLNLAIGDNALVDPATYVYKWYTCSDDEGSDKTPIAGANKDTYEIPQADMKVGAILHYTVEIAVGQRIYSPLKAKKVEIRDYTPITEDDIPTPEFGETIRFADIAQENVENDFTTYIDVMKLVDHPDVSYRGTVTAKGPNNMYQSPYGNGEGPLEYKLTSSGAIVHNITAEGMCEVEMRTSGEYGMEAAAQHVDKTHDFCIDTITIRLTPELRTEDGTYKDLTDKTATKEYSLGDKSCYFHVVGMDAEVTGEAAEYRASIEDAKLVIDQGSGEVKFVKPDGSNAFPERCNYAMLWLPDPEYPQWNGFHFERREYGDENKLTCYTGQLWLEKLQNSTLDKGEFTAKILIYVPGKTDRHMYFYRLEIPGERIEFAGNNSF